VSVGPDGNIYSVGTEGMGVFSLTPGGALRWINPESYSRLIVDYAEIVFGPNGSNQQLYFYANSHLRAVRLDGTSVFTLPGNIDFLRPGPQPAVAPDGSVHNALTSYTPNGGFLWSFATPYPLNVLTEPDIGTNGTHYFVQNLMQLFALNNNGSLRWHATLNGNFAGPVVDPTNTQLIIGSSETGDHAGYIIGASTTDGSELWRVSLPIEDPSVFNSTVGIFGFNQFVETRGRFSPTGSTAYLITATATGDNNTSKSFLYSLNTAVAAPAATPSPTPTPSPVPTATATPTPTVSPSATALLRSTSISLSAKASKSGVTVNGVISVRNSSGGIVPNATVNATWTLPNGSKQNQTAITGSSGNASFTAKSSRGTYMLTETNIAKSGYTFDSANSVLSKSITK
ncbi:MAG TPA: hypothetical protein VFA58_00935, partial [Chthoniobacterales bacterium]|nr:hypothetical protein [Chthoniobacterales bacterium]